jgi:hypothetical protein
MAIDPIRLSLELDEVVAQARSVALATGELVSRPGPYRSPVPTEAGDVLLGLLRDGTYDAAVRRVVVEDPELADE